MKIIPSDISWKLKYKNEFKNFAKLLAFTKILQLNLK